MSTRSARKAAHPRAKAPEPIITRTKSAQQKRQLRNKEDKKTEKPELTKPVIKSPKVIKTVKRSQTSLLKVPVVIAPDEFTQVEYYPNTLKRDVPAKKIILKPKHNFKVIAGTNKRKLSIPQKGIKSPPSKQNAPQKSQQRPKSSPEMSMQDMVRMMEETRSLSDEDFMEILTCPSPVWWEDPPDDGFDEDSIHTRSPETPPEQVTSQNKKRKQTTNTITRNANNSKIPDDSVQSKEIDNRTDDRFVKKKQKLEDILGNIKNKTFQPKNDVKPEANSTNRKLSESEDFSDLSFNEEEILRTLEEMEIPMEQSQTESNNSLNIKSEIDDIEIKDEPIGNNDVDSKNDNLDREILSIEIKKEIKEEFSIRSPVFGNDSISACSKFTSEGSSDEVSSIKKSVDIVSVDSCTNSNLSNTEDVCSVIDLDISSNSDMGKKTRTRKSFHEIANKKTKDLGEFITVYKITSEKIKNENISEKPKLPENTKTTKLETVRGKLNDFFKQCKGIRLKKMENTIPAIPLTGV